MLVTRPSPIYFGYGSNMWRNQMARRCPESKYLGIAYLEDWKWIICERGYATLTKSPGDRVYGLVYHISESDEQTLDKCEGVPTIYVKKYLQVAFLGTKEQPVEKDITSLVYIDIIRQTEGPPRTEYIHRMNMAIADAIKERVPEEYIEKYLRKFIPIE